MLLVGSVRSESLLCVMDDDQTLTSAVLFLHPLYLDNLLL